MGIEYWLKEYNAIVDTYHSLKWSQADQISELLKNLSVVLSHLEFERNNFHNKWIGISMQEVGVAAGERKANEQVPELYQLRRIMTAGYRIVDAMRSNISYAKKEN